MVPLLLVRETDPPWRKPSMFPFDMTVIVAPDAPTNSEPLMPLLKTVSDVAKGLLLVMFTVP